MSAALLQSNIEHWDNPAIESMYDKTLLAIETAKIKKHINHGAKVCDFGCGECEATAQYATVPNVTIDAVDRSPVRLAMAQHKMPSNVRLFMQDVLDEWPRSRDYDVVISQRLLINMKDWDEQCAALRGLIAILKPQGRLILSEGSVGGAEKLNALRKIYGLSYIPVPIHNLFLHDKALVEQMADSGFHLAAQESMGAYYFLTRGIQPALRRDFSWNSLFNLASATKEMESQLPNLSEFSRVKIWVFER